MNATSRRASTALVLILCTGLGAAFADARPVIITEQARILSDDPETWFDQVAIDGNNVLVLGLRYSDPDCCLDHVILHYQRQADGNWYFISQLTSIPDVIQPLIEPQIALKGNIGAVTINARHAAIFELTTTGWTVTPISLPGPPSGVQVLGSTVAFGFRGQAPLSVALVRKNASGTWSVAEVLAGPVGEQEPEWVGPRDFALADTEAAIAGSWSGPSPLIFDRLNGQWTQTQTVPQEYSRPLILDSRVALRWNRLTVRGDMEKLRSLYTRDASGQFTIEHMLMTDEASVQKRPGTVIAQGNRVFASDHTCDSISFASVYKRESQTRFQHEATLAFSDSSPRPSCTSGSAFPISVSGEWAVAALGPLYIFHVPQTLPEPLRIEDTFTDGNAADWLASSGAWQVLNVGGSYVYRQSNTQGIARTFPAETPGTHQSIQADVTIRSGAGPGPWAGFMLRYTNAQNYYYLLIDQDSIDIRRMVNGVFGPIATAPFNLVLGKRYRFRVEAIGKRLRAYLDEQVVADVLDESHTQGQAGLITWRAVTDFDNVIVSSNPYTALHEDNFSNSFQDLFTSWDATPTNTWSRVTTTSGATVYRQSSTGTIARALTGGAAADQIVTADVTARAFQSADGWAGLLARYVDNNNYYYMAWKNNGRASLRKRVNGVISTIKEVPMTMQANRTYRMRLEAIGSSLRFYVDGNLIAEGQDSQLPQGRYGLMTDRAAVDFDTFSSKRP